MMNVKRLLCLLAVLVLLLTQAACQKVPAETAAPTEMTEAEPSAPPAVEGDGEFSPTAEPIEDPVDNPITYFSMNLGDSCEHVRYLVAYEDFGETYVEYVGQEKKLGRFGPGLLHQLTDRVEAAGLSELNGQSGYTEGDALGSLYITYADGSCITADFSGAVPEGFHQAYEAMDSYFREIVAELPEYVPQPEILGQVDQMVLARMLGILNASGIQELDLLAISEIPKDAYFALSAGLSSDEGILNGTQCAATMMTTPYSLVIVTVREEGDIAAIREDFRKSMNWNKWVCVMPTDALIARKDNMVLCLIGTDVLYDLTKAGIEKEGWTEIETLRNPDM